ncbi:MAG: PASTA domain-containing protein [Lachnospiraceae bacterium]|nr:PASTA domain-containing protein [Lachnospiraceae bacterium]
METQCMGCMDMYDYELEACPHCGFKESEYKRIGYHLALHSTLADTYIVGKAIGYGGFGVTYVGYNAILEKKVAIKEYLPGEFATRSPGDTTVTAFTGDKEQAYYKGLEQFEREAKRLARLKNKDGIVDIYDSFRANNTVYIVMECLEGETLKSLLKREKKLSEKKATSIIVSVLKALKKVHNEGIIHRDISPENIFITNAGEVKLIDFGAARNATTGLSKSLSVIVKQGYAPPEQYFSKGKQGSWTDVYATAATYYKMLTGITPDDSMERKGKDTLVPPSKLKVKLSRKQENALLNALELNVKDRTATVGEFLKGITDTKAKVRRKKIKKEKIDLGKLSLRTKLGIGLGIVAVVLAFIVGYQAVRDNLINDQEALAENQVYVPNVLNMTYEEAEELLADSGLKAKFGSYEHTDYVPANTVVKQGINPGELVDKGTEVRLLVSRGGANVYFADYVGMSKDDVINDLDELQLYAEFEEVESSIAKDCIVSQNVAVYESVGRGTVIKFQVSKGIAGYGANSTQVPQFVGLTLEEAKELAKESELYLKVGLKPYSDEIPSGQIINQNYSEGAEIEAGTVIQIEVSAGVETVIMPDVMNTKLIETKELLELMGLDYEVSYITDYSYLPGYIVGANEEVGARIPIGTTVKLNVAKGIRCEASISTHEYKQEIYKVGDEVNIEILIEVEQCDMLASFSNQFVLMYDKEMLEYKGIDGDATATLTSHDYYGDIMLVGYSVSEETYLAKATLTFTALKTGSSQIDIDTYMFPFEDGNTYVTAFHFYGNYGELRVDDLTLDNVVITVK